MKTGEAEIWLRQQLHNVYSEREATNIASMVAEHITGLTRSGRAVKKEERLSAEQIQQLTETNQRLQQHEPVQYILQEAWFAGMKLYVNKDVLVPRPETEELVQWVIEDVQASRKDVFERRRFEADETTQLKILDVGTGSGCIALALKKAMPKADIWACDVSDEALNIARRNGSLLDIRVDFVGLNFLDTAQRKQLTVADIIVSNPPYIPLNNKEQMLPNVLNHEPHTALFVPDDNPFIFYQAIADFGKEKLNNGGFVYVEIHEDLGQEVVKLFTAAGYQNVLLKKDMQGKNRMVKCGQL